MIEAMIAAAADLLKLYETAEHLDVDGAFGR
jgi:hypothetical protein